MARNNKGTSGQKSTKNSGRQDVKREQPKKDSNSKRVNYDNARVDRVDRAIKQDSKKYNANDASEYSRNPELLKSAASLPIVPITGMKLNPSSPAVPGIMALCWRPTFGAGNKPKAMNQASDSMYSYVVHANSRNYSYTAPDLFIMNQAGIQVFCILSAMIRGYGVAKAYQEQNLYSVDPLLNAMGFKGPDMRRHLSQAWFDLNNLIDQTRQIWVPNRFPLMEHYFRLNAHVYKDAPGAPSQIYVPVQSQYFIFSETGSKQGSAMFIVTQDGKPIFGMGDKANNLFEPGAFQYDWSVWVTVAQAMITALVESEDRGIMYGDVLKAYGAESLYALPSIDASYTVFPDYNAEFLMQIENTIFVSRMLTPFGLVQANEDLWPLYFPYDVVKSDIVNKFPIDNAIINFHTEGMPSVDNIAVASRNIVMGMQEQQVAVGVENAQKQGTDVSYVDQYAMLACGSEVFTNCYIWQFNKDNVLKQYPFRTRMLTNTDSNILLKLMAFDWHPFIYDYSVRTGDIPINTFTDAWGDFDNYAVVDVVTIRQLHEVCLFSLYGVPQV